MRDIITAGMEEWKGATHSTLLIALGSDKIKNRAGSGQWAVVVGVS